MLIILEACDASGKTTLFKYLVKTRGYKPILTPRKPGPVVNFKSADAFDEFLLARANEQNTTYLLDRHTPSNYAYGKMRQESPAQLAKYLTQWANFRSRAGKNLCTIWLTRSPKAVNDDLISLTKEQDLIVLNAYKRLATMDNNAPCFNLIDNKHTYKDILEYING